ncbi:MAG TPA: hypothetical protein VJ111_08935 [Chitinophagaceae bacterium]|nr:hypothetical protein [Chitinophagaceae bacterium]
MKQLWNQHKEKFYAALFESVGKAIGGIVGGIVIIAFIYVLLPTIDAEKIEMYLKNYVESQKEMGKNIFSQIKKGKISNDSLVQIKTTINNGKNK